MDSHCLQNSVQTPYLGPHIASPHLLSPWSDWFPLLPPIACSGSALALQYWSELFLSCLPWWWWWWFSCEVSCLTLAIPRTVACQASLSMGFSKQEYWSGLPLPSSLGLWIPEVQGVVLFIFVSSVLVVSAQHMEDAQSMPVLLNGTHLAKDRGSCYLH